MFKTLVNYSRVNEKNAYIGNIQVSKGTFLTQIKKEREEAEKKKQTLKNFYKKVLYLLFLFF